MRCLLAWDYRPPRSSPKRSEPRSKSKSRKSLRRILGRIWRSSEPSSMGDTPSSRTRTDFSSARWIASSRHSFVSEPSLRSSLLRIKTVLRSWCWPLPVPWSTDTWGSTMAIYRLRDSLIRSSSSSMPLGSWPELKPLGRRWCFVSSLIV